MQALVRVSSALTVGLLRTAQASRRLLSVISTAPTKASRPIIQRSSRRITRSSRLPVVAGRSRSSTRPAR